MPPTRSAIANAGADYPRVLLPAGSVLRRAGEDLTRRASEEGVQRVFGREREVDRLVAILTRRYRSNPVIVGDPGVGKTVLVDHLAWRIVTGKVPEGLRKFKVCRTSFAELWGLVGDRSEPWPAYQRLLADLVEECSSNPILLFLDEIHLMWNYPISRNALKGPISEGRVQVIGATTGREYQRYFAVDRAFERRFQPLVLDPPDQAQLKEIVEGAGRLLGQYYGVTVPSETALEAIRLSDSYLFNRNQPDRALDVLESACMVAREENEFAEGTPQVRLADARKAVAQLTGLDVEYLGAARSRLENLALRLRERVRGQDEVIEKVAERLLVTKMRLDMNPGRPDGVFLFAGPTGVGKTELARAIAVAMTGSESHLLKLDMGIYKEPYSVNLLLGQDRGARVEDEPEPSILTRFAREHPFGVLLLDEVEKAHPEVLHIFLSILDDGVFTDRLGNRASFAFTTVIMTTNLGHGQKFHYPGLPDRPLTAVDRETVQTAGAIGVIEKVLPRELMSRIDLVALFRPLSPEVMADLIRLRLRRMEAALGVRVVLEDQEVSEIARRAEASGLGARCLDRILEEVVGVPVARMRLAGELDHVTQVRLTISAGDAEGEVVPN